LFTEAAQLSLKREKFALAIDLVEKIKELQKENKSFYRWHDQFLGDVVQGALKRNDLESANASTKWIIDKLVLAEVLRKIMTYLIEKNDLASASDVFDLAMKTVKNEPDDSKKAGTLIRFIPTVQKMDVNRILEVTEKAAKCLGGIPTLAPEDKPGSENYKQYVSSIMALNYNLLPVMSDLIRKNQNAAVNFGGRINRKEFQIITEFALMTVAADSEIQTYSPKSIG
jgi:hypothetical protein